MLTPVYCQPCQFGHVVEFDLPRADSIGTLTEQFRNMDGIQVTLDEETEKHNLLKTHVAAGKERTREGGKESLARRAAQPVTVREMLQTDLACNFSIAVGTDGAGRVKPGNYP
jgi:hypothetical protein